MLRDAPRERARYTDDRWGDLHGWSTLSRFVQSRPTLWFDISISSGTYGRLATLRHASWHSSWSCGHRTSAKPYKQARIR